MSTDDDTRWTVTSSHTGVAITSKVGQEAFERELLSMAFVILERREDRRYSDVDEAALQIAFGEASEQMKAAEAIMRRHRQMIRWVLYPTVAVNVGAALLNWSLVAGWW